MLERTAPSDREVHNLIMMSGECFSSDIGRLKVILNLHAPVFAKFVIHTPPPGFPPKEIREQWVGTELPVRAKPDADGIPVLAFEAIEALEISNKYDAVAWWKQYYILRGQECLPDVDSGDYPEMLMNIDGLEFEPSCGILQPAEEAS